MSKNLFTIKLPTETPRNHVAVEMQKQKLGQRTLKDRRLKRQNRNSWRKDHGV